MLAHDVPNTGLLYYMQILHLFLCTNPRNKSDNAAHPSPTKSIHCGDKTAVTDTTSQQTHVPTSSLTGILSDFQSN